jgi:SAM-dependent methyltransferase
MMFGTRDEFDYLECGRCGTLQLQDVPDLSKYYPADYYSFDGSPALETENSLKSRIASFVTKSYLSLKFSDSYPDGPTGRLYSRIFDFGCAASSVFRFSGNRDLKILDFGCGSGKLLNTLGYFGYKNLTGLDAFVAGDIEYSNGIDILKGGFERLESKFDLLMFHHSFEHLPDPLETLEKVKAVMNPNGTCLIRIPLASFAWEKYGVNWIGLDPPRHLFLFTEKSFRFLAEKAGFEVRSIIYDSTAMQFWGSEQYLSGVSLKAENSYDNGDLSISIFTSDQINTWKEDSEKLNKQNRGDQACFYLTMK